MFYEEGALYQEWSGTKAIVTREHVGHKRAALEFVKLTQLVASEERNHPTVALSDGTLILWMLEGKPLALRRAMLTGFLSAMDRLQDLRAPVCGYISDSGESDVINALRVGMCPEHPTNCDRCPWKSGEPDLPCDPIAGVTDSVLFKRVREVRCSRASQESSMTMVHTVSRSSMCILDPKLVVLRSRCGLRRTRNCSTWFTRRLSISAGKVAAIPWFCLSRTSRQSFVVLIGMSSTSS